VQKIYAKAAKAGKKAKLDLKAMKSGLAAAPKAFAAANAQIESNLVAARAQLKALKDNLDGYKAALATAGFKG